MHHVKFMPAPKLKSQLIHIELWSKAMPPAAENCILFKKELWHAAGMIDTKYLIKGPWWPELFIKA